MPFDREIEQPVELGAVERAVLARALHFDEPPLAAHHDVHVHRGAHVLLVVEVESRRRPMTPTLTAATRRLTGAAATRPLRDQPVECVDDRDARAGDRRRARSAVGLRARRNRA